MPSSKTKSASSGQNYNAKFKKIFIISFVVCILSFAFAASAAIDIGEVGLGARSLSLGGAHTAGLEDASAIFTNPAALSLNDQFNLMSMSGTILTDVNYLQVGVCDESPFGKLGFGYLNASVSGIPVTTLTGSGSTAAVSWESNSEYSSSVITFSYGTKLSRLLRGKGKGIAIGANLKYFLQGFSGGGTQLQDAYGVGMDADLGLLWQLKPWLRWGTTFYNFLPTSFGGKFVWEKNKRTEGIAMSVRSGLRLSLVGHKGLTPNQKQRCNLLLDYETARATNRPGLWHLGLEYWPLDVFTLRLGLDQKAKAAQSGIGVDNNFTAGIGLNFRGFTFDYAYHQFGDLAENTTHFFSFGYKGIEEAAERIKRVMTKAPIVEVVPKPQLKNFVDVSNDYWAKAPIEYLSTLGIMSGFGNHTFRPNKPISRASLAVILAKARGVDPRYTYRYEFIFKDVSRLDWVSPYVTYVVKNRLMSGFSDNTFRPEAAVSRAEAAVVFAKLARLDVKTKLKQDVYPDLKKDHWAAPAVAACRQAGFFAYVDPNNFSPKQLITRAEIAEILSKVPLVKKQIKSLISQGEVK